MTSALFPRMARAVVRGRVAGALAFACVLAIACSEQPAAPDAAAEHQLLLLHQPDGSQSDIYRTNARGTERVNLSREPATYGSISLSPDGRQFVFYSTRTTGCPSIWRMNLDGTDIRLLTPYEVRCNRTPRWSPDGRHIAFQSTRDGYYAAYVMNPDGTDPRRLSSPPEVATDITYVGGWTPDGRVVFMRRGGGALLSTYTVRPDGTDLRPLFARAGDHSPRWSPDGSRVAFVRETDGGATLHVMNADGSNVRALTTQDGYVDLGGGVFENDHGHWSPDGRHIAFHHTIQNVGRALHVIRADGTGLVRLSDHQWDGDQFNGWAPDGRVTLHRTGEAGRLDVFLVAPDGTGLVNLTRSAANEFNALWLPRQ